MQHVHVHVHAHGHQHAAHLGSITTGDATELREQPSEVLVDQVATLGITVADTQDLRPLRVLLESLGVSRLLQDRCRLHVRHDLLSRDTLCSLKGCHLC